MRLSKLFIGILLLLAIKQGWSQDSTTESNLVEYKYNLDSFFHNVKLEVTTMARLSFSRFELELEHTPDKADYRRYKWHKKLITQQPQKKNYDLYYSLACSLYELNKIAEAEKLFLTIVNSRDTFYTNTTYHSSGTTYGYGSFTTNYKNSAATYLTRIYLEQRSFDKALQFLEDAVHKYRVNFSCGTGHMFQQNEYNRLYVACYKGLKKHKELVDLMLPDLFDASDTLLINSIRSLYTQQVIEAQLVQAENSLLFKMDSTYWYTNRKVDGTNEEITDSTMRYTGKANIVLFDRAIELFRPALDDRTLVTREKLIADFKASFFYRQLMNIKEEGEETSAEDQDTKL